MAEPTGFQKVGDRFLEQAGALEMVRQQSRLCRNPFLVMIFQILGYASMQGSPPAE